MDLIDQIISLANRVAEKTEAVRRSATQNELTQIETLLSAAYTRLERIERDAKRGN